MANLKNVIYLSNEDYETLVSTGTVTIDGTTLTYSDDDVYITPDVLATAENAGLMSAADKNKLDGIQTGTKLYRHVIGNMPNGITFIDTKSTPYAKVSDVQYGRWLVFEKLVFGSSIATQPIYITGQGDPSRNLDADTPITWLIGGFDDHGDYVTTTLTTQTVDKVTQL